MNSEIIKINGLRLRVCTWGKRDRSPLILVHGWLDTGASFDFFARHLKDQFFLIAPDLRGYGQSEHTPSPLGYFFFEYVADLHQIIQTYSPESPVRLLGHSLGGAVASVYAGTYPDRISHLVNVEGFGFQRKDLKSPPQRAREWLGGLPPKEFPVHPDLETFAKRLQDSYPRLPSERVQFLAQQLALPVKGGYQNAADPKHRLIEPYPVPVENFYAFWEETTAKSLFILAQNSELAKYFEAGQFKQEMQDRQKFFPSGCQLETLSNCGHMVHHEKPEELAQLVGKFL